MNAIQSSLSSSASALTKPLAAGVRAGDGDHLAKSAATSQVKDADGDYKAAPKTASGTSSSGVQAALFNLKAGG